MIFSTDILQNISDQCVVMKYWYFASMFFASLTRITAVQLLLQRLAENSDNPDKGGTLEKYGIFRFLIW